MGGITIDLVTPPIRIIVGGLQSRFKLCGDADVLRNSCIFSVYIEKY